MAFTIVFSTKGVETYIDKENIYFSEIKWAVDLIEDKMNEGDVLLIHDFSWAEYSYLKKFNTDSIGYEIVILDSHWGGDKKREVEEIAYNKIKNSSRIYYLTSLGSDHFMAKSIFNFFEEFGHSELIYSAHKGVHTKHVYYYERSEEPIIVDDNLQVKE